MTPPDIVILGRGYDPRILDAATTAFRTFSLVLRDGDRWTETHAAPSGDPEDLRSTVTHRHPSGRMVEVTSVEDEPHLAIGVDSGSGGWISWRVTLPVPDDVPRDPAVLVVHVLSALDAIGRQATDDHGEAAARLERWGRGACAHLMGARSIHTCSLVLPGIERRTIPSQRLVAYGNRGDDMSDDPEVARLDAVAPTAVELLARDALIGIRPACYVRPVGIEIDDPVGEMRALADVRHLLGDAS